MSEVAMGGRGGQLFEDTHGYEVIPLLVSPKQWRRIWWRMLTARIIYFFGKRPDRVVIERYADGHPWISIHLFG